MIAGQDRENYYYGDGGCLPQDYNFNLLPKEGNRFCERPLAVSSNSSEVACVGTSEIGLLT